MEEGRIVGVSIAQAAGYSKAMRRNQAGKELLLAYENFTPVRGGVGVEHGRETVLKSSFEGTYGSG